MPIKGKGPLRIATEDFWKTFIINQVFKAAKEQIATRARHMVLRVLQSPIGQIMGDDSKRLITNLVDDLKVEESLLLMILGIPILLSSIIWVMMGNLWNVPSLLFTYKQNRIFEPYRADISSYIQMAFRNPGKETTFKDEAFDLGINSALWEDFKSIYKPHMTPTELIMALNRKVITDPIFRQRLKEQGWTEEAINAFYNFKDVVPPITDLIRFMVREAFSEDIVSKFQYDADFPGAILEFTRQLGLKDDWVKRYWRAHWDLPSASQGYEMLHRLRPGKSQNPFTKGDLEQLLRANDVPAFYRNRLIEISYHPLTRVDIRRMRGLNVIDKDGVYNAYLDSGYNEANAQLLADFVEKEYGQDRRELSRSLIERGYNEGLMSQAEAVAKLMELGYGRDEADYILKLVDLKEAEKEIKDSTSLASERFLRGMDSVQQLRDKLSNIGLTPVKIDSLVNKLERIKENDERFPTLTDLKKFYVNGIISEGEYREELRRMNISEKNVDRYIQLVNLVGD